MTHQPFEMIHDRVARLEAALTQIGEVCDDNAAASCNQAMALTFVRSIVRETLNGTEQLPGGEK